MTLPVQVLQELIELGRSGQERVPPSLEDASTAWRTLVCGHEPWIEAVDQHSSETVADLIRGLVLYCRASGRQIGGSVSPVIVLYKFFIQRGPDSEADLTGWVVANRTNPYEPFGTMNDENATTYEDYALRRGLRDQQARTNRNLEAERQQQALVNRRERERRESTQRLAAAVRRGDLGAVQGLLAKGADATQALPTGGSLVTLAEEHGREAVAAYLRSLGLA